jgi:hypothetical protein
MITTTTQSAPKCASNGRAMPEWMTPAQVEAYEVLAQRWGERAAAPVPEICGSAALVECTERTARLVEFAEYALAIMEQHAEWGADTLDDIAAEALRLKLGGTNGEGMFKKTETT